MGRHAIISDIHANLEALTAVLEDIQANGVNRIICLGDIVGYGPNPLECLQLLKDCSITILGNHELGLTEGGTRFNARARRAIEWTAQELQGTPEGQLLFERACNFPTEHAEEGMLYVHGSPCDTTNQYLLPRMTKTPKMLEPQFAKFTSFCFCGHTHLPGVMEPGRLFERPDDMLMNI
ncbi:MAG: metallophosphoesterase family protein, partial [Planctomycetota bacterium]